jgi:outer membrane protein assembly factor BamB
MGNNFQLWQAGCRWLIPSGYNKRLMLQSVWSVVLAAVVFPPAGFVLLWLRSGQRVWKKLAGSVLIAGWSVGWMMLFFGLRFQLDGSGVRPLPIFYNRESHYSELERSRATQTPVPVVQAAAPPKAESKPLSAYWTDFRGPHRDGRYDQTPILTAWPESGLPLVWKQPIGGGYASFVIARGRAFTIEQRRHQ